MLLKIKQVNECIIHRKVLKLPVQVAGGMDAHSKVQLVIGEDTRLKGRNKETSQD
jgi:hypothetical protein